MVQWISGTLKFEMREDTLFIVDEYADLDLRGVVARGASNAVLISRTRSS